MFGVVLSQEKQTNQHPYLLVPNTAQQRKSMQDRPHKLKKLKTQKWECGREGGK